MRLIIAALFTLFIFATNQAAQAFEHCEDPTCITQAGVQTQAEHEKQDPCCPTHCAISGHHAIGMPASLAINMPAVTTHSPHWGAALMPESANLEGPVEPPSLA